VVLAGTVVKVYEYASRAFVPGTQQSDGFGDFDLRVATYGTADSDGDLRLNNDDTRGSYAKRWMNQGESHGETAVEEKPEPDWGHLIRLLREVMDEHANDPDSGDKWCSEYEDTLDKLFDWTSDRVSRSTFEVKVRLRHTVSADDVVNSDATFGGYYEDADVDDDDITIEGVVRVNVEGDSEDGPDRDEVESVLDDRGFKYDSFEILDHEPID
jgi:hypothetical protein